MYVIEKEEERTVITKDETTEEEETERVEDVIILSDEVGIAHYIHVFNKIVLLHKQLVKFL